MTRWTSPGTGFAARHRVHAVALDAGTDTVRLGLPDGALAEFATPIAATRPARSRATGTAGIVEASQHGIRRRLPRLTRRRRRGFRIAATVPACAGRAARQRLESALRALNRGQPVLLMEAPLAAAAGAGIDTAGAVPRLVLDVGVHGSEVAVIGEGRVLDAVSCATGCHDIERAIVTHLYRRHHILATPYAAWQALRVGSATIVNPDGERPVAVRLNVAELAIDISDPTATILSGVRRLAQRHAAVLDRDPLEHGVLVVGGGALVPQLIRTLRVELGADVQVPHDPRRAAIRGVAQFIDEAERYPQLWRD
jgi:rod shape-determining protein MreB